MYAYRYALPGDAYIPTQEPVLLDVASRRVERLPATPIACSVTTMIEQNAVWWSPNSQLVYFLDRDRYSQWVALQRAEVGSQSVETLLRETATDTIVHTNPVSPTAPPLVRILSNGDVIWFSRRDGWGSLYYYDRSGRLRNQITKGHWIVRSIERVDESTKTIDFIANGHEQGRDPYEQYLYRIGFDGSNLQLLTPEPADHQLSAHSGSTREISLIEGARFSPSGQYFVDSYSKPDRAPVFVVRSISGKLVKELERADISKLEEGGYTRIEPFQVLAADGVTAIYGNLFRPGKFDPTQKYPVIDVLYQGPPTSMTRRGFLQAAFDNYGPQSLAELGFIAVTMDGRGGPFRENAFSDYGYGRLDKVSDLDDHIAGIRQLARRYPYMDLERVGADGASGGGYAAAHALLAHGDFYKVAVAAEGNHDQRAYQFGWGEPYIGRNNEEGYELSSNLPLAPCLTGKLLLMHGELDDNVPPTLTLKLASALMKANKDFDLIIVPNGNHTAYYTAPYFIRRKWDFFVKNLLGKEPPANYTISAPQ